MDKVKQLPKCWCKLSFGNQEEYLIFIPGFEIMPSSWVFQSTCFRPLKRWMPESTRKKGHCSGWESAPPDFSFRNSPKPPLFSQKWLRITAPKVLCFALFSCLVSFLQRYHLRCMIDHPVLQGDQQSLLVYTAGVFVLHVSTISQCEWVPYGVAGTHHQMLFCNIQKKMMVTEELFHYLLLSTFAQKRGQGGNVAH